MYILYIYCVSQVNEFLNFQHNLSVCVAMVIYSGQKPWIHYSCSNGSSCAPWSSGFMIMSAQFWGQTLCVCGVWGGGGGRGGKKRGGGVGIREKADSHQI